ncbi:inositol polyphosphate-5-phosphatase A-like isoform X5 [Tamandua tetradactyla]|uniref:inositol polyphosphate-5-phosphatase A-like isoform X5 n=1 Tax=Tamandua tetradactyla TaxID=48850 RepID=UPI00405416E6
MHCLRSPDVVPGFRHPRPFSLWAAWMPPIHVDLQLLYNIRCLQTLCTKDTMHTVWAADTTEDVKLIFRKSHNDCRVMLQLEKKLFDFINQEVF